MFAEPYTKIIGEVGGVCEKEGGYASFFLMIGVKEQSGTGEDVVYGLRGKN